MIETMLRTVPGFAQLDGEVLERVAPSPLNVLNRAIALAEWQGPDAGLAALQALQAPSWLSSYYLWDATLGELHRRRGDRDLALGHTERALAAAPTNPEKALLERRMKKIVAAYDAGCRRFDSALGGLGGCPFAQDALVGNIATETMMKALQERGAQLPPLKPLDTLQRVTAEFTARYSGSAAAD